MMATNLDRYASDLEKLIVLGVNLEQAMLYDLSPDAFKKRVERDQGKEAAKKHIEELIDFRHEYEKWYSQSISLIKQLLPERLNDFIALYEKPRNRKMLNHDNYTVQDYLEGLMRPGMTTSAGYSKFKQQLSIVSAAEARFESSLFEIRQFVQADLFDSEIESARGLNKHGFSRAAGAIAGVVLEKHLRQVCDDHKIPITKKHPGINDLNELLKLASVITIPQWRHITLMGDIRNLCDHSKEKEPTTEQVDDLVEGVDKIMKTIF